MSLKGVSNNVVNSSFFSKRYENLECVWSLTDFYVQPVKKRGLARAPFYTLMF